MNITYIGNLAGVSGGPAYSLRLAMKAAATCGHRVRLLNEKLPDGTPFPDLPYPTVFPEKTTGGHWRFAADFSRCITPLADTDIFHIQGLWVGLYHQVAAYARKKHTPYVISLRGMFYPQALAGHSQWIKRLARLLYQDRDLRKAACIQATCEEEMLLYRKYGFRNPVALIPNPVELPRTMCVSSSPDGVFRIGYLGRLHPRKHLERLLEVQHILEHSKADCELLIMGSGDPGYEKSLHELAERLGLKKIRFCGFVSGAEKTGLLRTCSVTVLPSDFENFGNSVVESLKEGVPVIASKGTPWRQLAEYHCGWWVENDTDSLLKAVQQAMTADLPVMGKAGFRLLAEHYSLERHAEQLDALYQWIAGSPEKPDFIRL